MRVSTIGMYLNGLTSMQRLQSALDVTQRQISSGRRILTPSDDPIAAARSLELREAVGRLEQFDRNANIATNRLSQEESALQSVNNVLQRVRELSLQGNNATQTNESRRQIAVEIRELREQLVQIANQNTSSTITRRYEKGDVISTPGQFVDGLYTVLEGYLESRIPRGDGQEDFVRVFGPGDHWGEILATAGEPTRGTLTATEDTRVLILKADDFRSLREAFPALDEYFRQINPKIYAPSLRSRDAVVSEIE